MLLPKAIVIRCTEIIKWITTTTCRLSAKIKLIIASIHWLLLAHVHVGAVRITASILLLASIAAHWLLLLHGSVLTIILLGLNWLLLIASTKSLHLIWHLSLEGAVLLLLLLLIAGVLLLLSLKVALQERRVWLELRLILRLLLWSRHIHLGTWLLRPERIWTTRT